MSAPAHPSVIERYYKRYFDKREDRPDEDVCVLVHSNKMCIVTITPEHKALKSGPIKSIRYIVETGGKKVGDVHGKRKLQAIKTRAGMPLCEIISGDGTPYIIKCPVRGKLCELNEKFDNDLTIFDNMPETNGYLAIILHYFCNDKDVCSYLLTEEQYLRGEVLKQSFKKPNDPSKEKNNSNIPVVEVPDSHEVAEISVIDGAEENIKNSEVVDDGKDNSSGDDAIKKDGVPGVEKCATDEVENMDLNQDESTKGKKRDKSASTRQTRSKRMRK